jgi:hypothetical protein
MGDENASRQETVPRKPANFSEWINEKFEEFRKGKRGSAASVSAFGRQFGAGHQVVLAWFAPNSGPPHKPEYIAALIKTYGVEAYEYLNIPPSLIRAIGGVRELTPREERIIELLNSQSEDRQESIVNIVEAMTLRPDQLLSGLEKYLLEMGFTDRNGEGVLLDNVSRPGLDH